MDTETENKLEGQPVIQESKMKPFDSITSEEDDGKVHFRTLFKENWLSVMIDCLVFGSFGMGVAILGPTLFDLGCQTRSGLKEMDWVFFVQLLLTLVGSISAGFLVDRGIPIHIVLLVGTIGLPFTTFLVPACSAYGALLVDLMVMGWCMGCIDCMANLRMLNRFGTNVSPFLQAMHFFYGLGAFISPMIAAPFILNVDCTEFIDGVTVAPSIENETVAPPQPQKVTRAQHLSHSEFAFFTLGTIQFVTSTIVVVVIILEKKKMIGRGVSISQASSAHSFVSYTSDKDLRDISGQRTCFVCGTREILVITVITSSSLFLYDGLQSSFADYIYSYAEKNGLRKQGDGAILNACFWGLFAFGRLLAIPLATRFTPAFMLSCNLIGSVVAMAITLIFRGDIVAIYIGSCLLGLFLSSMSPTVISMAEQFIDINPSIASCLVVCAALGETLCPVIVGNLFVALGPPSFLVFCTALGVVSVILYIALYLAGKTTTKFREATWKSFMWLQGVESPQLRQAGENDLIKSSALKYYSGREESRDLEKSS